MQQTPFIITIVVLLKTTTHGFGGKISGQGEMYLDLGG